MAELPDVWIDWPQRIIWVGAPRTKVTQQDLVDTLRSELGEAAFDALDDPYILDASGKEDLGGGQQVGITAQLLDAVIAFEERVVSSEQGSATSGDANGKSLVDTTASFLTTAEPGALVVNFTDNSVGTILRVLSDTEVVMTGLSDGTNNYWTIGDTYKVWKIIQCEATGGNLVATDDVGGEKSPVLPTFGTQIIRTSSSSATIASLEIAKLQRLIELLRAHHGNVGDMIFWNPHGGDDSYNGETPDEAVKTFSRAHDIATDWNHDLIVCIPGNSTGETVATEYLSITKAQLYVRGAGQDFTLKPDGSFNRPAIDVAASAVGFEAAGFAIEHTATGTDSDKHGIRSLADDTLIENMWIRNVPQDGIYMNGSIGSEIKKTTIENSGNHGMHVLDCERGVISRMTILDSGSTGIVFEATNPGDCINNSIDDISIYATGGYGIDIQAGVTSTFVGSGTKIKGNALTPAILDNGTDTLIKVDAEAQQISTAVWAESLASWTAIGTTGGALAATAYMGHVHIDKDNGSAGIDPPIGTDHLPSNNLPELFTIAGYYSLHKITFRAAATPYVMDRDLTNWQLGGDDDNANAIISLNGFTLDQCAFRQLYVTGTVQGFIVTDHCYVDSVTGLEGSFYETVLVGTHIAGNYSRSQIFPYKAVGGFNGQPTTIDMGAANAPVFVNGDYLSGDWVFTNVRDGDVINLGFTHGTVTFDSTCIGGVVNIDGNAELTDDSSIVNMTVRTLSSDGISESVWTKPVSEHYADVGTFGSLIQRVAGLQKENYVMDELVYNGDSLLTSARIRLFHTNTAANAATSGGVGEGEYSTYTFSTTPLVANPQLPEIIRSTKEP